MRVLDSNTNLNLFKIYIVGAGITGFCLVLAKIVFLGKVAKLLKSVLIFILMIVFWPVTLFIGLLASQERSGLGAFYRKINEQ